MSLDEPDEEIITQVPLDSIPLEYSVGEVLHWYIRALADSICDVKKYQPWVIFFPQKQVKAGGRDAFDLCNTKSWLWAKAVVSFGPFGWLLAFAKAKAS